MFGLSLSVKGGRRLKALSLSIRSTKAFSHTERPTAAAEFDTIEKGGQKATLAPPSLPPPSPLTLHSSFSRRQEGGEGRKEEEEEEAKGAKVK